ncbi:MAG: transposase [Odoribacteraceae bacterium]|nr:transposase [Odoribacteraceae bacterium]
MKKQQGKGVDSEGRWLKKDGKIIFGFKHHDAVDDNGLILAVHTTVANEHDSRGLSPLLEKLPGEELEIYIVFPDSYFRASCMSISRT